MNGHEELLVRRGARSGMYVIVAVHSTALGPALGGCRMWCYDWPGDAIEDAQRLARAMTMKAAAAGLELGGGKGVICTDSGAPPAGPRRRAALADFAEAVESLDGRYITAEDVGTGAEDMAAIAERTRHVVGLPEDRGGAGDPSPLTARGVEGAIRACAAHRFGSPELAGRRICVLGLGHVGGALARRLAAAGVRLAVSDINPTRRALAERLGAEWLAPETAVEADCDVLAPCALGGTVDAANLARLRCRIICGSANNLLAAEELAEALARRSITYAPDFIANAGGLMHVYGELRGYDRERVEGMVDGIGATVARVLAEADSHRRTPLAAAMAMAAQRIADAGGTAAPRVTA